MSAEKNCIKNNPFISEVIYKPVEGEVKGLADVRNITVVQNDSDTYKVKVYNVESEIHMFPIIPDSVNCDPGEQKPTGDMWTPWCDNQQALEEGAITSALHFRRRGRMNMCTSCSSQAGMSTKPST